MTRPPFLAALPVLLAAGCAQQDSFETRYSGDARLTPKQEKVVVRLARAAHVKEVQEIRIAHDGRCGPWIHVKGRETQIGRTVRYHLVVIGYLPWHPYGAGGRPHSHDPVVDGFWVHRSYQTGATILEVRGREHRVRLGREVSVPKAERLAEALLAALEKGAAVGGLKDAELKDFNDLRPRLASMDVTFIAPYYEAYPEEQTGLYKSCFESRDRAEYCLLVSGVGGERIGVVYFERFRHKSP